MRLHALPFSPRLLGNSRVASRVPSEVTIYQSPLRRRPRPRCRGVGWAGGGGAVGGWVGGVVWGLCWVGGGRGRSRGLWVLFLLWVGLSLGQWGGDWRGGVWAGASPAVFLCCLPRQ